MRDLKLVVKKYREKERELWENNPYWLGLTPFFVLILCMTIGYWLTK